MIQTSNNPITRSRPGSSRNLSLGICKDLLSESVSRSFDSISPENSHRRSPSPRPSPTIPLFETIDENRSVFINTAQDRSASEGRIDPTLFDLSSLVQKPFSGFRRTKSTRTANRYTAWFRRLSLDDPDELEAKDACDWLRAAGFPQYWRMYEEHQFPVNIAAVQKDHEFLDPDSLQALFRRLHTLNRCAMLKLDNVLRKQHTEEDSDEEDDVALSRRWQFHRRSRTWSRVDPGINPPELPPHASCDSVITSGDSLEKDGKKAPATTVDSRCLAEKNSDSPIISRKADKTQGVAFSPEAVENSERSERSEEGQLDKSRLQRSSSERIKNRAKAFVRRMELIRTSRRGKKEDGPDTDQSAASAMVIGDPVLVSHHSASPPTLRYQLRTRSGEEVPCLDLSNPSSPAVSHKKYGSGSLSSQGSYRSPLASKIVDSGTLAVSPILHRRSASVKQSTACDESFLLDQKTRNVQFKGGSTRSNGGGGFFGRKNRSSSVDQTERVRLPIPKWPGQSPPVPESPTIREPKTLKVDTDSPATTESPMNHLNRTPPGQTSSLESSGSDSPKYYWERRDSGVGSSLSRSPSVPVHRQKDGQWHSFSRKARPSAASLRNVPVCALSVGQLATLQKYSLLKLTALMEKHSPKAQWQWGVHWLIRKIKPSEKSSKMDTTSVFAVPLHTVLQRTGQPLPQCILQSMRFLLSQSSECVGLFRKSGVRSRIQRLRDGCRLDSREPLVLEPGQAYDVADLVKQYFRELPEPLLTSKLSETIIAIYLYIPEHLRIEAVQKCIIMLPDENREALQALLYFLTEVASHAGTNQMTAANLSVCFAPSLFQLSPRLVGGSSPQRRHKTLTTGLPNEKELLENQAAQEALTAMIKCSKRLFLVPRDMLDRCDYSLLEEWTPSTMAELTAEHNGSPVAALENCVTALLKEHRDKWRGWLSHQSVDGVEIASKNVGDGHPLRLWRCSTEAEAPPKELLARILRERHLWDEDVVKWKVVEKIRENAEIFQFVCNDMPPLPTREYCVFRLWQTSVPELRGGCVLVEASISSPELRSLGGIRGQVLASRYLIEPAGSGRSRITHITRIDSRGRSKQWYQKAFGHILALYLVRIRDSFHQDADGPETKV